MLSFSHTCLKSVFYGWGESSWIKWKAEHEVAMEKRIWKIYSVFRRSLCIVKYQIYICPNADYFFPGIVLAKFYKKALHVIQMLCDSTSHNQPHYKYNVEIKQGNLSLTSWCALVMKCFTHMFFLTHLQTANLHPWAFPSCAPLQMCTFQCGYI